MGKKPKEIKVRIQGKDFGLILACLRAVRNSITEPKEILERLDVLIDYYDEVRYFQSHNVNA